MHLQKREQPERKQQKNKLLSNYIYLHNNFK
jgi:hypothetical protein